MLFKLLIVIVFLGGVVGLFFVGRDISTAFIRLFYGKYSPKYYSFYRKIKGKYPFPVSIKDNFIHYFQDFLVDDSFKTYVTTKEIKFEDYNSGDDFKSLKKQLGNPHNFSAHKLHKGIGQVLGYNSNKEFRKRSLYYFYDSELVMEKFVVKNIEKQDIKKIKSDIISDYNIEDSIYDETTFIIKGARNTVLCYVDDGFAISLRYYVPKNEKVHQELQMNLIEYRNSTRK